MNFKLPIKVQLTSPSSIMNLTDHFIYLYIFITHHSIIFADIRKLYVCFLFSLAYLQLVSPCGKKQDPKSKFHTT